MKLFEHEQTQFTFARKTSWIPYLPVTNLRISSYYLNNSFVKEPLLCLRTLLAIQLFPAPSIDMATLTILGPFVLYLVSQGKF